MIAQHVANILAKKTLGAFPEFLNAIDIFLSHSPCAIWRIGWTWLEFLDFFLHPKIPGNVRDQIFHDRKRFHRLDRDRSVERQFAHSRHAHQFRHTVDFRRTRSALPRLAVPSTCKVVGLRRLNLIYGIEHDHAFGNLGSVIAELAALRVAAPDFEKGRLRSAHVLSWSSDMPSSQAAFI